MAALLISEVENPTERKDLKGYRYNNRTSAIGSWGRREREGREGKDYCRRRCARSDDLDPRTLSR